MSGIELGRRTDGIELFGLTSPLLTTASGAKMGKTAAGAVWLNPDMCSPYDYWQYWRNSEDADVERFLKLFTELPLKEIATLAKLKGAELNEAKKILATEATALVHGRDAADRAAETARTTFEEGLTASSLPTIEVPRADLEKGLGVLHASLLAGFVQFDRRGQAPNQGRRPQGERRGRGGRATAAHSGRPQPRRRDQALARQEAARFDSAGLGLDAIAGPRRICPPGCM